MSQASAVNPDLTASNVSILQLASQHSALSSRLEHLNHLRFLSAEEELERARIKKEKLHLKDEMRALMHAGSA